MFVTDFCTIAVGDDAVTFNVMGINYNNTSFMVSTFIPKVVLVLSVMVIGIAVICLIKFKKRMMQIKLCRINMLLILGLILAIFYGGDIIQNSISSQDPNAAIEYQVNLGTLFPLLCIVFNLLASKAIKKDEAMVRSANRIR
jgi:hypothetical protein